MIDCKVKELQQGVDAGLCKAAGGVRESFFRAYGVVERSLSWTIERARHDRLARPGSCSTHLGNCKRQQSRTRAATDSGSAPKGETSRGSEPTSPSAANPRDFSDRHYLTTL